MLPDFIVIGAMKAGTTSLFQYLRAHPQVFMPWRKEIHFFSHDENWNKGIPWYEDQFANASSDHRVGEASPSYSKRHLFPDAADRLVKSLPDVRIIYLIREPIARMQSQYLDMLFHGNETRPFSKAVASYEDYVLTSRYGMQIEPYVERVGGDRVLVATSERLRADPETVLNRVFEFIGVEPVPPPQVVAANLSENKRIPNQLGRYVRKIRPFDTRKATDTWPDRILTRESSHAAAKLPRRLREDFEDLLAPDVRRLQGLVDVDLSPWNWLQGR